MSFEIKVRFVVVAVDYFANALAKVTAEPFVVAVAVVVLVV